MRRSVPTPSMCVMLLSTSRFQELPPAFWEEAVRANPHGLGLMTAGTGGARCGRTMTYSARSIGQMLRDIPAGRPFALHLRLATAGAVSLANTHPVRLRLGRGASAGLMHNGTLAQFAGRNDGRSDSVAFAQEWLGPRLRRNPGCLQEPGTLAQIADLAGPVNRLILLDGMGRWSLVGEHEGFWLGATWVSNPKAKAWLEGGGSSIAQPAPTFALPSLRAPGPSMVAA